MSSNNEQHEMGGADEAMGLGGDASGNDLEAGFVSEEKKPFNRGALLLLGILVVGGGGMYFMHMRSGPATAGAATGGETAAASETITKFLSDGGDNIKAMEKMLRDTEKVVEQFKTYPAMNQVPLSDLQTNPFAMANRKAAETKDDKAEQKKREAERQAVLKAVQGLQLQSIMITGTRSACMINNTLYQEGQQVESFTIEKISQGSVIVKNGAYRFELKMQK